MKIQNLPATILGVLLFPLGAGFTLGTLQTSLAQCASAQENARPEIGSNVGGEFSLRDVRGNRRSLEDLRGEKATVAVILGTECPLANLYIPRILELEKEYRKEGVTFLAIYPNESETLDDIAAHAYERSIPFPVLKDFQQKLADALGIQRTPEVALLDPKLTLLYRGRIDDQYGVGSRRPAPSKQNLKDAMDELLAGKAVSRPEATADGCLINRQKPNKKSASVNYYEHVAPIVEQRCQSCHRPGRSAPFTLTSYEEAVQWAEPMREVVEERRMPPWHADSHFGKFENDRSLDAKEIDTIVSWIRAGSPKGDESKRKPTITWHEGWNIGKPDQIFEMPFECEIPADGVLPYKMVVVPTNFTEDRWITMAEAMPGNDSIVHHIIIYMISPERLDPVNENDDMSVLVAWAPGDMPLACPKGTGLRIPKGTELLFEMHYTPNGKPQKDRSKVGILFSKDPPEREIHTNMLANQGIVIPAHDPHHQEERVFTFENDARLLSLIPHMHWRGKSYEYEVQYPDGRKEKLLSVPRWDFNWQTAYWFDGGIKIPKGSIVRSVATWDNSRFNAFNPDPTRDVPWGLQTWDEMMVGWMTYVWEDPSYKPQGAPAPKNGSEIAFALMDRNKNGLLDPDEIPQKIRGGLTEIGLDSRQALPPAVFKLIFGMARSAMFGGGGNNNESGNHSGDKGTESSAVR